MKFKLVFALAVFFSVNVYSQAVYERHSNEVYNYLGRLAQKGLVDFDDLIRPLTKAYLKDCLDSVNSRQQLLSQKELQELHFYLGEYADSAKQSLVRAANGNFQI